MRFKLTPIWNTSAAGKDLTKLCYQVLHNVMDRIRLLTLNNLHLITKWNNFILSKIVYHVLWIKKVISFFEGRARKDTTM